jgi:hypothetical protein
MPETMRREVQDNRKGVGGLFLTDLPDLRLPTTFLVPRYRNLNTQKPGNFLNVVKTAQTARLQ